ncbi:uncharacterized protein LOC142232168 [Haematobia irritans]|uniref:uncharacterized protein LOC142232168 n=1 Tax=Haematobia irritans TaxID=7368 RepID=UPI003F500F1B
MLTISKFVQSNNNFKCAEIYCMSPPAVFTVTCILCNQLIDYDQFVSHFQRLHLTLVEESIPLEGLVESKDLLSLEAEDTKAESQSDQESAEYKLLVSPSKEFIHEDRRNGNPLEEIEEEEYNPLQQIDESKQLDSCNETPQSNMSEEFILGDKANNDEGSNDETETEVEDNSNTEEKLVFQCPLCPRSYSTKPALQKHHYSAHNPNKWDRKTPKPIHKCEICNEVFRSAIVLRSHQYKHTGIFCDICGKPFKHVGDMVRHKIRHSGIKEHKCKECPKEFFTAKELKGHMFCHNGMPIVCEVCGKKCRDGGDLKAHMRRHTGERPAKCEVCGKSFFTKYDLSVHSVAHTNDRPFSCEVCGSRFQRKKALRVHKRIHSKERSNHVCQICGKSFAQSNGLKSHLRTHATAIKPPTLDNIPVAEKDTHNEEYGYNNTAGTVQLVFEKEVDANG